MIGRRERTGDAMALRIFGRRMQQLRETAAALKPGELAARNAVVVGMAARYVRYMLAAGAGVMLFDYLALRRAAEGSKAAETLGSGFTITLIGAVTIGIIFTLVRVAERVEAQAVALDDRPVHDDPDYPPSREVRRLMERAVFMVQLGYRLVMFAGLCLAVGLFFAFKGVYQM